MIYFRISTKTNPLFLIFTPFYLVLFLYFLTTSVDLYNLSLLIFKIKPTYFFALLFTFCFLIPFRTLHLPYAFTLTTIGIMSSMVISSLNSVHPIACTGFLLLIIFSFIFYFLVPYTLFHYIDSSILLKIYLNSFFLLGFYAFCQFAFSFFGIFLPGVTQYIFVLARGQAFAYEPSYYALYMVPFTLFYTTKFILQDKSQRHLHQLIWPNILFLISTSTGCFFAYLIYFAHLVLFRLLKIIKLNLIPLFSKCAVALTAMLGAIWIINQKLITSGLLKFFFTGASHGSVTTRWKGIIDYWNIFLENPFFGVGLGAAPFYYALKEEGSLEGLLNSEILVKYCPTNAFTELLASLGLLGLIFFALFIFLLIQTFRSTHKIIDLSIEERINLIAMAVSLSVMFVVLQFNQSITRPYLWVHVGIFVGYAQTLKIKYRKQTLTITGQ